MIVVDKITEVTKYITGIKVVIFDLDDTLYSEKEYVRSGYQAIAKALRDVGNVEQKLWIAFENKKFAIDDFLTSEGIYSRELKDRCLKIYRQHVPNISFYEGVEEMLETIKKNGHIIGIITDGRPEGQKAKIKSLNLEKYVDKIIITDELGGIEFRKPNPKSFMIMKDYFDVDYSNMCYIGDNLTKDFIAPEKLGIKSIYFNNRDGLYC